MVGAVEYADAECGAAVMMRIFSLVICATLVSCGGKSGSAPDVDSPLQQNDSGACTQTFVPGIVVEVRDDVTNAPLAGRAVVAITDGDYQTSTTVYGYDEETHLPVLLASAYERPGVYAINVSVDGYVSWHVEGVVVRAAICHVETMSVAARLQRISS